MKARNIIIFLIALTALTAATSSCRSSKTASDAAAIATNSASVNVDQRFNSMVTDGFADWTTLSVPVKIELSQPKHFSISGRAYMRRDQSVMFSLRFLGMEVANIYIDNDSVFIAEKFHKYYIAEDVKSLLGGYPLSIADLQSLLIGQPFLAGAGRLTADMRQQLEMSDSPVSATWTITPPQPTPGIGYTFAISMDRNRLQRLTITSADRLPAAIVYTDSSFSPAGYVSSSLDITATAAKTNIAASLRWNFSNAEWNAPDMRQWKRPKGYTRIKQQDIIKMLSSLQL